MYEYTNDTFSLNRRQNKRLKSNIRDERETRDDRKKSHAKTREETMRLDR